MTDTDAPAAQEARKPVWRARFVRTSNGRRLPERAVLATTEEEARREAVASLGKKAAAYQLVGVRQTGVSVTHLDPECARRGIIPLYAEATTTHREKLI